MYCVNRSLKCRNAHPSQLVSIPFPDLRPESKKPPCSSCVCLFVLGLLLFLPIFAFDHFGRVGISALSLSNDVRFSIERDAALHVADSHKEHANNAKGNNAFQSSGVQQNLTEMISLSGISQSGIIHQQVWAKEILMPMEAS